MYSPVSRFIGQYDDWQLQQLRIDKRMQRDKVIFIEGNLTNLTITLRKISYTSQLN